MDVKPQTELQNVFNDLLAHSLVLQSLYTNARIHAILVTDIGGHVIHMNQTFCSEYGYNPADVQGAHGRIFFTQEDRDKMVPELEIEKVREQGFCRDRNFILHANGNPMWSDGESLLIVTEEGHSFIFKIIQNLQEQKRMETFLTEMHQFNNSVIDSIHDGMLVLNREGQILRANHRFHELFLEQSDVEGKYVQDLQDDFFTPDLQKELQRMMYTGDLHNYDFELTTAGSHTRNIAVQISFIFKDHDRTRLLLLFRDVTLQRNAQKEIEAEVALRTGQLNTANEALQNANTALKRSNTNLEQFAYAASHNLKEPARKIHLFTNYIKNSLHDSMATAERQYFERLEGTARHMTNQINGLLAYAQAGIPPSEMEEVDLNEVVESTLQTLDGMVHHTNATVRVGVLPVVRGHADQLQQLIFSLLSNALKFQPAGRQPQVLINAGVEQGYHVIEVKDNGIGFAPKYAEDIFHIFYRLHSQHEYEGAGIGLAVAYRIAEHHDGFIKASSKEGEGAGFRLFLPDHGK